MTIINLPADPDTEQLAVKLSRATGKPIQTIVKEAIGAYEAQLRLLPRTPARHRTPQQIDAAFQLAIARLAPLPVLDPRTPDEIIGYDEHGLPH